MKFKLNLSKIMPKKQQTLDALQQELKDLRAAFNEEHQKNKDLLAKQLTTESGVSLTTEAGSSLLLQNNPVQINQPPEYNDPKYKKLKPLEKEPLSSLTPPLPICAVCQEDILPDTDIHWITFAGESVLAHKECKA